MRPADLVENGGECSVRCSGRYSRHQEHPPPAAPASQANPPRSARDSRCSAAEIALTLEAAP